MGGIAGDVRMAIRSLGRSPWFTILAVAMLSVGIGATTALFSLVDAVLLRPLPFSQPDRLVEIWQRTDRGPGGRVPGAVLDAVRTQSKTLQVIGTHDPAGGVLRQGGATIQIRGEAVSPNFGDVFGVQPTIGRGFVAEDGAPGASPVMLVSYSFWQQYLGAELTLSERALFVDDVPYTVVGVMPPGFQTTFLGQGAVFWTPHAHSRSRQRERELGFEIVARLAPGITAAQAEQEIRAIAASVGPPSGVLTVVPLRDEIVGHRADALLLLLLATVAVLAVVCGNLAQLLIARASHRATELATRKALGAGTWPLLRLALSESMMLATLGGVAGVAIAYWLLPVLLSLAPQGIPRLAGASIDTRVLVVTVAATLLTGVLFGLAPALRLSRLAPLQVMRTGGADSHQRRARTQSLLITLQVTVAVALFVLASLVVDQLLTVLPSSPGFATDSRAAFLWTLDERQLADAGERRRRLNNWMASLEALPEIHAVAVASAIPFGDDEPRRVGIRSPDDLTPVTDATPRAALRAVSDNYFMLMDMPVWRGRHFDAADRPDATRVAIVNRSFAMRLDPASDVLGRRIRIGNTDAALDYEIVGIVPDTRWWGMTVAPLHEVYIPLAQDRSSFGYLVVHSSLSAPALTDVLRREFFAALPGASLPADRRAVPLEEMINASIAGPRFSAAVIGSFSTVTLLLAAIGTFGLVASTLAARRRELGIRTALGARPSNLLHLSLWPVLSFTLIGIIVGLAIAAGVTRVAQSQLYIEDSTHPSLFGAAALVMLVTGGLAAYIPARRAVRVDPSTVLRDQ